MIRWLFWFVVIGLIGYAGYSTVQKVIFGTSITNRQGSLGGAMYKEDQRGGPSQLPQAPPEPKEDNAGFGGLLDEAN